MHRWFIGALCLAFVACAGKDYGEHPPFPATGSVSVNGKPAEKARVTLHHEGNWGGLPIVPYGWTDADGKFVLETYGLKDGAPAGQYRVTIVWPAPHTGRGLGPDKLGGKYNKADNSELTATIEKKTNVLAPFELTVDTGVIEAAVEKGKGRPASNTEKFSKD